MASAPVKWNSGSGSTDMGWVGPAIMGGASLGGAALGGKAAKKQAEIQAQTADKALQFTREQETYKRQKYEEAMRLYQQQWQAQQARRDALLASYGFSMPASASMPMPAAAGAPAPTSASTYGLPQQAPAGDVRMAASEAPEAMPARLGAVWDYPGQNKYGLA